MERPMRLLLAVDVDDLDLDFLPHFEHLVGMLDAIPGKLGEVDEAVGAVDVDEGAEIGQAGDAAGVDLAFFQFAR